MRVPYLQVKILDLLLLLLEYQLLVKVRRPEDKASRMKLIRAIMTEVKIENFVNLINSITKKMIMQQSLQSKKLNKT